MIYTTCDYAATYLVMRWYEDCVEETVTLKTALELLVGGRCNHSAAWRLLAARRTALKTCVVKNCVVSAWRVNQFVTCVEDW